MAEGLPKKANAIGGRRKTTETEARSPSSTVYACTDRLPPKHGRVGAWVGGSMGGWEHGWVGVSMGGWEGGAGVGAWGWGWGGYMYMWVGLGWVRGGACGWSMS